MPDTKYQSELITRLIKKVMVDGKMGLAEKIVYSTIEAAAKELDITPLEFVNRVVDNLRPGLEIKSRRVGGANYQVPVPVTPRRQEALAIRWVTDVARSKIGAAFDQILKKEMLDAYNGIGSAFEKKIGVEKMAEANKAFAHFKW